MNIISHCIPSSKRWIVIIAGLAWSLFARICYASPLPAILGQAGLGTAVSDTNSSGLDYDDYHYTNHTDSQIQPRHIQLDSRGKGMKKSLIKAALWLNPDWALLGFAYVTPEEGEVVGDGFIYLQPKLGMPAQNPDNRYWTCLVYASKKNINKFKPRMFYRSELAPNQSPPLYTHSSTADDRVNSQAITFFSDPSFAGVTVMQVPFSAKFVSDWQLLAECYKSPNKLPKELVGIHGRRKLKDCPRA